MKRTVFFILLLNGAVLVFAQNPAAYIREITGTVELKRPGSTRWRSAVLGERIEEKAIISTGFGSAAVIAVGDTLLTVKALTRLSLDVLLKKDDTETVNVGLNTGRIKADVKPPAGGKTSFSVQTPSATAAVRGTSFAMDTNNIYVHEGTVVYEPGGASARPVTIGAGQESRVNADTGLVINPLIAAEANLALPVLPGQNAAPVLNGGGLESGKGNLEIVVTLTPGNNDKE